MNLHICSFIILSFILHITSVASLECYVCKDQEDNYSKCVKTILTCEYGQDVCLTEIKWGSTPYWDQAARKQFYISKRCSTKSECQAIKQRNMGYCTHLWYQDWICSDCCRGDRCNYYVISGGPLKTSHSLMKWIPIMVIVSYLGNIIVF